MRTRKEPTLGGHTAHDMTTAELERLVDGTHPAAVTAAIKRELKARKMQAHHPIDREAARRGFTE